MNRLRPQRLLLIEPPWRSHLVAGLFSLGAVAVVSGAVFVLDSLAPVVSLGGLYIFAVLPVAALWGLPYAVPVSVVSMLVFNWLFLPPTHSLRLADSENWVVLAVYLVTAICVSWLSARVQRRADDAEQQRREALLAADTSALLLDGPNVRSCLDTIAARAALLLGADVASIELDVPAGGDGRRGAHELRVGDRRVGVLVLGGAASPSTEVTRRVCAMLASLLATALDREAFAHEAMESEARRQRESLEAEALRRSDVAKTAVLRSVSHDLRSPITAITTAGEVLVEGGARLGAAERAELAVSVLVQARRLDRLVANLLELSRLEAGAAIPQREPWTVDGLVARALDALAEEAVRVLVELEPDAPPVEVDPAQIERALVNVIENALKFSPDHAPVLVRARLEGADVEISIVDQGPGIPAHERERVFEAFVRGNDLDGERGSGLGLAIARGFVAVNGGRMWVHAEPGAGAAVVVSLPASELPARAPA